MNVRSLHIANETSTVDDREREPAFKETSKHHFIAGVLQRHGLTKANENMVRQYFVRKCVMREQLARSISCDKRRI